MFCSRWLVRLMVLLVDTLVAHFFRRPSPTLVQPSLTSRFGIARADATAAAAAAAVAAFFSFFSGDRFFVGGAAPGTWRCTGSLIATGFEGRLHVGPRPGGEGLTGDADLLAGIDLDPADFAEDDDLLGEVALLDSLRRRLEGGLESALFDVLLLGLGGV